MKTALILAMRSFALARSRIHLFEALIDRGWRVVVACEALDGVEDLESVGVEVRNIPFYTGSKGVVGLYRRVGEIRKVIRLEKPYLVHAFNAVPVILSGLAMTGLHPEIFVNTITGLGRGYDKGGLYRALTLMGYGLGIRRSSHTIFQNTDDFGIMARRFPDLECKMMVVIGSGVDTQQFHPASDDFHRGSEPRVLMVSRLLWSKGVYEYVEAAKRLKSSFPKVRFQLAGEFVVSDPDGVQESWVREKEENGTIEFLGYVSDLEALLPEIDVVVHPTKYREGVPRIIMEAGACGVPVVVTRGPGNDDVVVEGETGLFVDRGNIEQLTKSLGRLLKNPESRNMIGKRAVVHIRQNFDIRMVARRYLDLYDRLNDIHLRSEGRP